MLGIPFLSKFIESTVKKQTVADFCDHLNYYVTSYLLAFFAIAISAKQYFGTPIQCWVPSEFRGGWEKYAESFCFISNSYHVPMDEEIPSYGDARSDHISYYRWVPIMLALQGVCFFLPNYFWNIMHRRTSINPVTFLKEAEKIQELTGEKREEELGKLRSYFMETVAALGTYNRRFHMNANSGKNAMLIYMFVKLLYVFNIYAQMVLLTQFLGESYLQWGYQTALNLIMGVPSHESKVFPRVIMCDFQVRRLANLQNHTVQCVIMMNMINEKLYFVLYFWFIFLAATNVISFAYYALLFVFPYYRTRSVLYKVHGMKKSEVARFVEECLHPDGVLLLKFLKEHIGGKVTYDLVNKIAESYNSQEGTTSTTSMEKHSPMSLKYPPTYHQGFYHPDCSAPLESYLEQGTLRVGEKNQPCSSRSSPTDV